ncbi:MAG: PQQ-binding-like beta-propeller repeat protein [Chloroflexia bacterium]|nr:PQQ-binding-like beta-propeller repeat protein [Chloroflexia bacterium]
MSDTPAAPDAADAPAADRAATDSGTAATFAGPPVIAHGLVYAGTADARLLALNATTGQERWHSVGSTLTPGYAPVVAGDVVYLLHAELGILAFAAADGAPRWLFEGETRGELLAPLTLAPNPTGDPDADILYLGSDRGILRAIQAPALNE